MWLSHSPLPAQVGFPQAILTGLRQMGSPVAGAPEVASAVGAVYDSTGLKPPRERRPWTPLLPVGTAGRQGLTPQRLDSARDRCTTEKETSDMEALFLNLTQTQMTKGWTQGGRERLVCSGLAVLLHWAKLWPGPGCSPHGAAGGKAGPEPLTNEGLHFHRLFVA